jgi:predicted metal-binding membrane protein
MGLEHGLFCVGCCWILMLLLFAAGVMNLVWVAVIAALVLVEKLAPAGPLLGRLIGIGLMAAGAAMMVASV